MIWTVTSGLVTGMSLGIFAGKLFPEPRNAKGKYIYLGIGLLLMVLTTVFGANNL